jgi:hypothetical protein
VSRRSYPPSFLFAGSAGVLARPVADHGLWHQAGEDARAPRWLTKNFRLWQQAGEDARAPGEDARASGEDARASGEDARAPGEDARAPGGCDKVMSMVNSQSTWNGKIPIGCARTLSNISNPNL